ncbi:MAG: hypothetical protein GC129_04385 [Proteobacteria bacterium]|nr:hypothetical protein [Pseudomonadota bacterium]
MIFKLINYTVMGIAVFYAAEGVGLIEKGKYFPTLPRLESSASDPMAWLGAAQWGFSQLGTLASSRGADFSTGSVAGITGKGFNSSTLQSYAERLSAQRGNTARLLSAYYK